MKIERLTNPDDAARWCAARRARGARLGLVPTMGALHEGHLGLVRAARARCDALVVSVFVNPLQFGEARDLEHYPRDFEGDARALDGVGCDLVFTGTLEQFFPASGGDPDAIERIDPGPAARGLEGEFRAGHFAGVATIVSRLFELVGPELAFFGQKDFQQCLLVQDLARARGRPEVVVCPTARAADGLALSSRNALLKGAQRERASVLYRALCAAQGAWRAGARDAAGLSAAMRAELARAPLELEYAEVRDPSMWSAEPPRGRLERAVALVAARLGGVRLIDCLRLDGDGDA